MKTPRPSLRKSATFSASRRSRASTRRPARQAAGGSGRRRRSGKRRLTLVRTGDLRESIRVVLSGGNVEVGTDIYYARIHQRGGPIDAEYKRKSGKTASLKLPRLNLTPGASSAAKLAQSAFRRQTSEDGSEGQAAGAEVPRRVEARPQAHDADSDRQVERGVEVIAGGRQWEAKAAMTTGAVLKWIGAACLGGVTGVDTPPVLPSEALQ